MGKHPPDVAFLLIESTLTKEALFDSISTGSTVINNSICNSICNSMLETHRERLDNTSGAKIWEDDRRANCHRKKPSRAFNRVTQ